MRAVWPLSFVVALVIPILSLAEIIPIALPDSYDGYQPVGLIKTSDGYILAGNAKNPDSGWDVSLLWLSNDYSLRQPKLLSGNSSDLVSKILSLHEEHFLLLTNTASDSGDLKKDHGILDINISKLDKDGNQMWTSTLGGKGINQAQDTYICDDGRTIAVAGWFNAAGGDISKIHGGWDILAATYNALGERIWVTSFGSADDDMMGSILCDHGNVYVIYNSWVKGRNWDIKFFTLDVHGKIVVEKSYGGHGSEIAHKIIRTQDGNFLILGSTDSVESEMGKPRGKIDLWVVKINPQGDVIWQTRFGGSENDVGRDIAIGLDGSYWLLGSTESRDGDITEHIGSWDVCVFNIDNTGHLLSSETYGTLDEDQPIQILALQTHMLFLYGTKKSDIFSEPFLIKKE